ncbi:MAG: hypothetical protein V4654_13505 [Bdellovibrionota bacterium]
MIISLLSLTMLTGFLPDYKSELLARANGSSTYNLPSYSSMGNTSPSINNQGDVTFRILSGGFDQNVDHSEQSAIWLKNSKEIDGRVIYFAPQEKLISEPEMLNSGDVLFTLFDEVSNDGLFIFDTQNQFSANIFPAKNMAALSYPQLSSDSAYVFRSTDSENNRMFFEWRADKLWPIADEDSGYAYLFGPSVNDRSQWLFKARLGEKFNFAEQAIDQIVLLTPQFTATGEKSYEKTIIAQDSDADPLSPYKSFDNSPMIANAGYVVFTATLKDRSRAIVAVKSGVHFIVAQEKINNISQIEMFSPKINDNGFVVFRAKDENGLRGIFLANPFVATPEIKKLIGEGDAIMADQGMATILKRDQFPGFGGNVDINNNNEIVFSAVIATENQKWIFGSAIYKLHPL